MDLCGTKNGSSMVSLEEPFEAPLFIFMCFCFDQGCSHNKPYINGKLIYLAFRLCINLNFEKCILMTGFVVQGHI